MLREPSYLEEEHTTDSHSADIHVLAQVWPYVKAYPFMLVTSFVAIVVAALTVIGVGAGIGNLVDHGLSQGGDHWLTLAVWGLFAIVVVMAGASYVRLYGVSWLSEKVIADLRSQIFKHLLTLDMTFFESTGIGEIQSRLTTDTTLLQIVIGTSIPIALRNILIVVGGLSMLIMTSLQLTGVIIAIIPLVLIPIVLLGRRVRKYSKITQDKTAGISSLLDESFSFIRTLRAFGQETAMTRLFEGQVDQTFATSMVRIKARALMSTFVMILVFGAISVIVWMGGQSVMDGAMTAGQLSAFLFYAVAVAGSAGSLSEIHGDLQRAAGAADRIFEFLDLTPTLTAPVSSSEKMTLTPTVEFQGVDFAYESRPSHLVLNHLSFEVKAGETVALVGPSGAGKTTLFSLLLRFYDPQAGVIAIGGHDIKTLPFADFRSLMGWVPQEPGLFSTTVFDNIRFGKPEATLEDIEEAAQAAHAHEFIKDLPQGYFTSVGEKGVQLSGGQRQRIAIARALLKDPKILLLDEATSALDTQSERLVQSALETLMKGRTTLVIAHRLSTIQNADRILVLDRGVIKASGSHADLINTPGLYQKLATAQFGA